MLDRVKVSSLLRYKNEIHESYFILKNKLFVYNLNVKDMKVQDLILIFFYNFYIQKCFLFL